MRRETGAGPPGSLPPPGSPLIGRDDAVARVLDLLDASPLVTLTGAAGVGKTRLAMAASHGAEARFRDRPIWVDLVPVAAPPALAAALMAALDMRDPGDAPALEAVAAALADRQVLLVLDNAEHVAAAVRDAVTLLMKRCPGLAFLVTSREPLGVEDEAVWVVPSLTVPDPTAPPAPEELERIPAVALFLARVREAVPDYVLTADDALPVAQICRGLDGIPLAIEFAAARVRSLSIQAIAQRLDRALGLLGESTAVRPRHMTLRAALDWSHDLLDERERTLFRRLGVFSGSFTLETAEAVCAGVGLQQEEIAGLLAGLVDRSLVVAPEPGAVEARYRLLELLRQYARRRLGEADETEEVERRHAEHFIAIAEAADERLRGPEQLAWHGRLVREHDELLAVLHRSRDDAGAMSRTGLRLAAALGYWWAFFSNRFHEARTWLRGAAAVLSREGALSPEATAAAAKAALWCGWLAFDRNDLSEARTWSAAARPVLERVDPWHGAFAYLLEGYEEAFEKGPNGIDTHFAESRRRFAEAGDEGWADVLIATGEADLARMAGDLPRVEERNEAALAILRRIGDEMMRSFPLQNLAHLALDRGDTGRARTLFAEAISVSREFGNTWVIGYCLAGVGRLAATREDWLRAGQVLAATEQLLSRIGGQLQVQDQGPFDASVERVRSALGEHDFEEAWRAGRALTLEAAVALGLGEEEGPVDRGPLTPRQLQVAELVGRGLTNREIAASLSISEHTAERHVENILARLGLSSRVEIATWMVRRHAAELC